MVVDKNIDIPQLYLASTPMIDKGNDPPEDDAQKKLIELWNRILLLPEEANKRITAKDNFYYVGGDSLLYKIMVTEFAELFPDVIYAYICKKYIKIFKL